MSSLLLFNTHQNPYKKYVGLDDNLAGVVGPERPPSPRRQRELHAAPKTVAEGDVLPAHELEQYTYQPPMGDVPQFTSLPQALPLAMLANDEQWSNSGAQLQSFAPSLPMLPSIEPGRFTLSQNLTSPANASTAVTPSQTPVVVQEAIPLPPPETVQVVVPEVAALELPLVTETSSTQQDAAPPEDDGGFLSQIRQGKKLKPAAEKKEEEKKPAPAPAGDLFGDLILALQRRRNNLGGRSDAKPAARKEGSEDIALPAESKEEEEKWDD